MSFILTFDFGSTFTKLCAIDVVGKKVIGCAKAFTTIHTDVREGFNTALYELEAQVGKIEYTEKLACSSAGGGLKMVTVGLVPELTAKAGKMAASSAGAKVTDTFSYELNSSEQEDIYKSHPDILLLCGGTDGGNKEIIIKNAKKIASIERDFSVIYAGNKSAADESVEILRKTGKNTIICNNVMPVFNVLDIASAKNAIRSLFIEKIIHAKGLSEIQKLMTREIIPTPLAVFDATELLSKGHNGAKGIGDLLAVDVGGATTDVYSMSDGKPSILNAIIKGLPEPFAKRSVEGDLGLRYNIDSLADSVLNSEPIKDINEKDIKEWLETCKNDPAVISEKTSINRRIDEYLTHHAVNIAVERHCGTLESVYTPLGETIIVSGKDLSNVPVIIGIGGPVINSDNPKKILEAAVFNPLKSAFLKPKKVKFYIDKNYIFSSMGLLSKIDPNLALFIMKDEISEINIL